MENGKKCNKCAVEKSLDEFFKDKRATDGRYSICKLCKTTATLRWRAEYRETYNARMRAYNAKHRFRIHLKTDYGITPKDWQKMFDSQNGKCAICDKETNKLVFDH